MTTIIAFVSQKGGVGKSTLSRALAREASIGGLRTKIADLDTQQGTCVDWQRTRLNAGIQPEVAAEAFATAAQALRIALQLACALQAIHAAGVLHRDLKPGNVVLREDGSLALIDFGLSRHAAVPLDATDRELISGTPQYMSPEQGHGEPIDERSDLYSLGVILYEMLTGRKPFTAEKPMAIVYLHRKAPLPVLPEPLLGLQPLLERLLAKAPADRFESAAAAAAAVQQALEDLFAAELVA